MSSKTNREILKKKRIEYIINSKEYYDALNDVCVMLPKKQDTFLVNIV